MTVKEFRDTTPDYRFKPKKRKSILELDSISLSALILSCLLMAGINVLYLRSRKETNQLKNEIELVKNEINLLKNEINLLKLEKQKLEDGNRNRQVVCVSGNYDAC